MHLPDPNYTSSPRAQSNFLLAVRLSGFVVLAMFLAFVADTIVRPDLLEWGLRPREASGLLGVLTTPLLHASWAHLFSNLMPLWVGLSLMVYLYPNTSVRVVPLIYLLSSLIVWFVGRQAIHVGASGLVYGVLAFLAASGLVRRDLRSLGVSLMVAFVYGSIVWGLLPFDSTMSWELHGAGSLVGIVCAVAFRNWDKPPFIEYDWEQQPEDEDGPE